jgi:hypothetical protein
MPKKPQLLPFTATPIAYGQKTQFTPDKDTLAPLLLERLKCAQNIIGSLLCYARAVDKLLIALNTISVKAMLHTEQLVKMLLNYIATHPNDGIVYRASHMVLSARMQMQDTSMRLDPAAGQVHISITWKMIQLHASTVWS